MRIVSLLIIIFCIQFSVCACWSTKRQVTYGVQPGHEGFVPARIAVLPCMIWPSQASYPARSLSTAGPQETETLCKSIDEFVVNSFRNQPYVHGFSPKVVAKLWNKAHPQKPLTKEIFKHWKTAGKKCEDCLSGSMYYLQITSQSPQWRAWLNEFSRSVRYADAALMPILTHAYQRRKDLRGVIKAESAGGVVLLLLDTNTGDLLWTQSRDAVVRHQRNAGQQGQVSFPDWQVVLKRLLTSNLWFDFPGRINP